MRPISLNDVKILRTPVQHFSDCYLVSSIGALARSNDGAKLLRQNIARHYDGFYVTFRNVNGIEEKYHASAKELEKHISYDKYYNYVVHEFEQHPIVKAVEIAMGKLLKNHPAKKPLLCRFPRCQEKFEYNKPSNFMEMFTGKKPFTFNEAGIQMTLKKKKDEAVELFEKIGSSDDFSIVTGTGLGSREGLTNVHCYTIEGVNIENRYIQIFDCRKQKSIILPFDKAIRGLKFLTGYFSGMLK